MSAQTSIPVVYRILFTWVDGFISLLGAYIHFFDYENAMREHFPTVENMPYAAYKPLFFPIGGGMLFSATVQLGLLPFSTKELRTWKVVQLGLVLNDVTILISLVEIMKHQGHQSWAEAAGTGAVMGMAMTGVRTLARLLFLAGIGLTTGGKAKGS